MSVDFSCLSVLILLITVAFATKKGSIIKFPKDQSMDIPFPPKLDLPSAPGLPIGHLRPLGHQRRSAGAVKQASHTSWNASNPLFFKSVFKEPADYKIWPSKDDMDSGFADLQVLITKRSISGPTRYEAETYPKYLDNFDSEEWLLDQVLTNDLANNIQVPQGFECLAQTLYSVSGSLTSGTTSDDMRIYQHNTLQCVISGRRDYILMKKVQATPVTKSANPTVLCGTESVVELDPELVNVFDNPWITAMTWQHASLEAGDCLLIPADTIFHTNSYGLCETVSYRWDGQKKSCKKEKGMKRNARPYVCINKITLKPEMCEFAGMDPVERWRELLLSLRNHDDILTQACFSDIVDDQVDADVLFSWFETIPVTADILRNMKPDTLKKIMEAASVSKAAHHQHDEL